MEGVKIVESEEGKGRKRRVNKLNWKREKAKTLRYMAHEPIFMPTCGHQTKAFKCAKLTSRDVKNFHKCFYGNKTKMDQDKFLLKHTVQQKPAKNKKKCNVVTTHYFIKRNLNNSSIRVCQQTFLKILNISKYRVQNISSQYFQTGEIPKENRGGDRKSGTFSDKKGNVKSFIESLKAVESHYTREKSTKVYMSSDCSIRKLWRCYNDKCELPETKVKYEYFRRIFVNDYNIGFSSPATDVCSTCLQLKTNVIDGLQNKIENMTRLRVHRLKYKAFYEMLGKDEDNVFKLSFDCQKNLILPKLPDQSAYYTRQLYLYNFTICNGSSKSDQHKNNVFIYTWLENEFPRSSEQIASTLHYHLCKASLENMTQIQLFADGCPGQNKNYTLIGMLIKWLLCDAPKEIQSVQITFPIVGHSFLPPDRIFGRIEKITKKKEIILNAEDYFEIFDEHGTVKRLGEDVIVFNWKKELGQILKAPAQWHFKFHQSKRIIIKRSLNGNVIVKGETAYKTNTGAYRSLLKKGKKISMLDLQEIPKGVAIKQEKKNDIEKLLKNHFGPDWKEKEELFFYKELLERNSSQDIVQFEIETDDCSFELHEELHI